MADSEAPAGGLDPAVVIPPGVLASAAAAEAAHKAAYATEETPGNPDTIKLAENPPPADQTPPPAQPEPPPQEEDFERRYKAMKGRYDHLYSENRQLASRLGNLEQTLATVARPAPRQQEQADPTLDQITAEEINDYGEDFLNLVAKQAKRTLGRRRVSQRRVCRL